MKIKKIQLVITLLGISIGPLYGGYLWELTPQSGDTYVLQPPAGTTFNNGNEVQAFLKEKESLMGAYSYENITTNMGLWSWKIDYSELEQITDATGLSPGEYYVVVREVNSSGTTTMVLDSIAEKSTPYEGQPFVRNVLAKQIAGTKHVEIKGFVALGQDAAGYGDKSSKVEFWFKSNPSSLQWLQCYTFINSDPASGTTYQTSGPIQSGSMTARWNAGSDMPNFSTETGKIRVLVFYEDDGSGNTRYESGWDGYEAENGPSFTMNAGAQMIAYNQTSSEFTMYIQQNHLERVGSFNYQGPSGLSVFPVYNFTESELSDLLGGVSGNPAGKYAFGEVDTGYATMEPKLIPVN